MDLWFSEPMYPESIVVHLLGEEPTPIFSVAELGWETEVFGDDHWRGYVPTVVWEFMRNRLKGERRLRILDWDLETPGAHAYEYPLHMSRFVASGSDENAGVERNTIWNPSCLWNVLVMETADGGGT